MRIADQVDALTNINDMNAVSVDLTSYPENIASLRTSFDIGRVWQLDFWARYRDMLMLSSGLQTNGSMLVAQPRLWMDARFAWRPRDNFELALVGKNLLRGKTLDYVSEQYGAPTLMDKYWFVSMRFEF